MVDAGLLPEPTPAKTPRESINSATGNNRKTPTVDEAEEAIRVRLETMGMHAGANYTERYATVHPNHTCHIYMSSADYVVISLYLETHWISSNSFAKTYGLRAGTSK